MLIDSWLTSYQIQCCFRGIQNGNKVLRGLFLPGFSRSIHAGQQHGLDPIHSFHGVCCDRNALSIMVVTFGLAITRTPARLNERCMGHLICSHNQQGMRNPLHSSNSQPWSSYRRNRCRKDRRSKSHRTCNLPRSRCWPHHSILAWTCKHNLPRRCNSRRIHTCPRRKS